MDERIDALYRLWCDSVKEEDLLAELRKMESDDALREDAFYCDLSFGTAGLRGVLGAGTNRMNLYTVGRASQGLANYVVDRFPLEDRRIAISYDSRIQSDEFARQSACIFAAAGISVWIYPELMPTPCLSYAVRELKCAAGVMVTASHNPSKYNGYKAYGPDGCQIGEAEAEAVLAEINKVDPFRDICAMDFEEGLETGLIHYIGEDLYTAFINEVKNSSVLDGEKINRDVAIVYSPLNGTGLKPVLRALRESGFTNITVVKEQEQPDGHFPTCPYPNPEIREAMALGMDYAKKCKADILIATDPDCDRVGIAVRNIENGVQAGDDEYRLLTGNQVGVLLTDFICARRAASGKMPACPVIVKSLVSTDLADRVAASYGAEAVNVLTGFKNIGDAIARLEDENRGDSYLLGFEESYGYLSGTYVRDKDAVNGSFMIAEMFAYYATQGISLLDKLNEIYARFGYCLNKVHSFTFEGSAGFKKMQEIMEAFRAAADNKDLAFGGKRVTQVLDYAAGVPGVPKANMIKFVLEDNCSVIARPSGTEPKLKAYMTATAPDAASATAIEEAMLADVNEFMK